LQVARQSRRKPAKGRDPAKRRYRKALLRKALELHNGIGTRGARVGQVNLLTKGTPMPTIVWIIVVLLLIGALPLYPYSSGWGYYPSGGLGLLLVILILLAVFRGGGV
jgi:hypothetical protein